MPPEEENKHRPLAISVYHSLTLLHEDGVRHSAVESGYCA